MNNFWDAHVHFFPKPLFQAIWKWFSSSGWVLPYANWDMDRYVDYLQGMGMERAFLLTYAHKPNMSLELNRWVRDICLHYPCFVPFACIHPQDSNLEEVIITALDHWKFAGFKLQLAVQQFAADDPRLDPIYQAALERQKPLIIHTGTAPYSEEDPLLGLDHLERVMERWPELKVVVPHLGFYEFEKAFSLLGRYPNVYLDTSWILGNPKLQLPLARIIYFMERFPERFLYGSDFPIMEYKPECGPEAISSLGLTQNTLHNILCGNAQRLIGL